MTTDTRLNPDDAQLLLERCAKDPVYFLEEILGVEPWEKQKLIIESVRDNTNTCVASGHGVGKTFVSAATALWFLFTHYQSRVITTAPTNRQVESILWAEIWNLFNNARVPLGGRLLKTSLNIEEKWSMKVDPSERRSIWDLYFNSSLGHTMCLGLIPTRSTIGSLT